MRPHICPLQGAKTSGRVPREATVSVSITLATALTGDSTTSMVFRDAAEAENGAIEVAGSSAAAAAEQYQSAVRLQNMTGQVKCSGRCGPGSSLQPRICVDQLPAAPVSHARCYMTACAYVLVWVSVFKVGLHD